MKPLKDIVRLFMLFLSALLVGCGSDSDTPLTVTVGIETSTEEGALAVVDPPKEIILTFSEPINKETVEGNISLQLVKISGATALTSPSVEVLASAQTSNQVIIRTKDGTVLPSGEEYKLVVTSRVKSLSGSVIPQGFIRYFATDYDFASQPLFDQDNPRTVTVVISDIHLGDQRGINDGYGWTVKNRAKLVGFLKLLRQRPNIKELVIAGDLFDEWVAPMTYDTFNGSTQSGFVDMIVAANQEIIDAFNAIIKDGLIAVTYVPGNHDMLVTSDDIQRVFPGIRQARDAQGLGSYTPAEMPELVIEHGHRYDFFNAPDPYSNRDITKTASILSPGFFVSKIAATSDMETGLSRFYRESISDQYVGEAPGYYFTYLVAWQLIMREKPVKESWDAKIIRTGIDGYTENYAINDLIPQSESSVGVGLDVLLYKDIVNNWWDKRQTANKVPEKILAEVAMAAGAINVALDMQADVQYFLNPASDKRIVIFGHTHDPKISANLTIQKLWSIYANSGTWVDTSKYPTCTFVAVIPQKENGATTDTVTVYQYIDDTNFKKIGSRVIRNYD
jgi:UDP-2,3-diacylglucosamine pyrophosphatase LpxH